MCNRVAIQRQNISKTVEINLFLVLQQALKHSDVYGNGCTAVAPLILGLGSGSAATLPRGNITAHSRSKRCTGKKNPTLL